jgi:hypothetical protein
MYKQKGDMIARWVLEDIIGVHGKNFDGERGKIC